MITAKELIKKGPDSYELVDGSMTSCRLPKPDWRILAPHILVDNGTAKARNANFRVLTYPVLFLPYVTHGVDTASRQSGFLIPALEVGSSIKGTVIGEQYYWVINRSADLVVGFQYYSLRGLQQNAEFRYKGLGRTLYTDAITAWKIAAWRRSMSIRAARTQSSPRAMT